MRSLQPVATRARTVAVLVMLAASAGANFAAGQSPWAQAQAQSGSRGRSAGHPAFTDGVVSRNAVLRERPYSIGKVVAKLEAGTEVEVLARRGYWLEVRSAEGYERGWLRLFRVRPRRAGPAGRTPKRGSGGGFFASISRGATSLLGGARSAQPRETTTIGIRGLSAADLSTASPDPRALKELDRYSANPSEARRYAAAGQLEVYDIPEPKPVARADTEEDSDEEQDKSW